MQLTNQDLEKIKYLAKQWGKIISDEAFGEAGPVWADEKVLIQDTVVIWK